MCGICGACALAGPLGLPEGLPERMVGALSHRGPDEFGAWRDGDVFLGHARLSIIDLSTGQQPLANEDGQVWITFNGEVFNYPELRAELEGRGHVFRTRSDTETIVHAYEEWGERCVDRFNGQWAFAIWDRRRRRLLLARDRYGVRPLYYTRRDGHLLFASEIKALCAWPGLVPPLDPAAVAEVFTYWVNVPPGTPFRGIWQLPPGHTAVIELGREGEAPRAPAGAPAGEHAATLAATLVGDGPLPARRYWHPSFLPAADDHRFVPAAERRAMAEKVREALVTAATIRLRADVPVGAYLSGGLDSSTTAALIHRYTSLRLKTFSVGFEDAAFDETAWQEEMARHLGTEHTAIRVGAADIAGRFPEVVWHCETPILRTAPSPLYALSGLVRRENYKVVLTGEGADEVFVGYDVHREAKVRAFWARRPEDRRRARLLTRLYPYLAQSPPDFLAGFYGVGIDRPGEPFFSHRPRWNNGSKTLAFLRPEHAAAFAATGPEARLAAALPAEFAGWGPVARCQYLEITTFLSGYLLSSQGDRMLMGHSVEGRFPFLDPDVGALANALPASAKLESLREKSILKDSVRDLLPDGIVRRSKQPYRAPDSAAFRDCPAAAAVAEELLGDEALGASGLWLPERVGALRRKWRAAPLASARENMAFVGVLSAQLLHRQFGPDLPGRLAATALAPERLAWRRAPA